MDTRQRYYGYDDYDDCDQDGPTHVLMAKSTSVIGVERCCDRTADRSPDGYRIGEVIAPSLAHEARPSAPLTQADTLQAPVTDRWSSTSSRLPFD